MCPPPGALEAYETAVEGRQAREDSGGVKTLKALAAVGSRLLL